MARVTLNLPDNLVDKVKEAAAKKQISATDVFRRSLEWDLYLEEEEANGSKFLIKHKEGDMVQLIRPH